MKTNKNGRTHETPINDRSDGDGSVEIVLFFVRNNRVQCGECSTAEPDHGHFLTIDFGQMLQQIANRFQLQTMHNRFGSWPPVVKICVTGRRRRERGCRRIRVAGIGQRPIELHLHVNVVTLTGQKVRQIDRVLTVNRSLSKRIQFDSGHTQDWKTDGKKESKRLIWHLFFLFFLIKMTELKSQSALLLLVEDYASDAHMVSDKTNPCKSITKCRLPTKKVVKKCLSFLFCRSFVFWIEKDTRLKYDQINNKGKGTRRQKTCSL